MSEVREYHTFLVCDRCGKKEPMPPTEDKRRKVLISFSYCPFLDTSKDYNGTRIDLCPSCTDLYLAFMIPDKEDKNAIQREAERPVPRSG